MEQILNLPAHRTLYYRDRRKIKLQKIAWRGPALVFCSPASSCHNWAMASGHIITQAPWADSSDATYIAGCFCLPSEQKAGLHFPCWSVCWALCDISKVNEGATISASLACVGGASMGSFDLGGGGGVGGWRNPLKLSRGIRKALFKMLLRLVPLPISDWGAVS